MTFGLVLGGGGARGISHTIVLEILDELKIKPKIIAGTSIGAIIAVLYSEGKSAKEIQKIFLEMNFLKTAKLFDLSFSSIGLLKGERIIEKLKNIIKTDLIENLPIPVKIVATDLVSKKEIVFDKGDIFDALRASISIPGIFKPFELKNMVLVDGGITNQLPIDKVNTRKIIAVDITPNNSIKKIKKFNLIDAIIHSVETMQLKNVEDNLNLKNPTCYLKFELKNISILDFHKVEEILKKSKRKKNEFKKIIIDNIK